MSYQAIRPIIDLLYQSTRERKGAPDPELVAKVRLLITSHAITAAIELERQGVPPAAIPSRVICQFSEFVDLVSSQIPNMSESLHQRVNDYASMRGWNSLAHEPSEGTPLSGESAPNDERVSASILRSPPSSGAGNQFDRRAAVDAYIDEVFRKTGKRITRTAIWKAARYKSRTEFERWERNDVKRPNMAAHNRFTKILIEKPHLK